MADFWCTPRSTIMGPFRGKKYIRNPSGAGLQNSSRNKGKGKAAAAPAAPEASTPPPSPSRAMTCGPMPGDTVCFGKRARTPGQTALRSPNPESPSYVTVTSGATPIAETFSIRRALAHLRSRCRLSVSGFSQRQAQGYQSGVPSQNWARKTSV